jgi:hypothetical protein
LCPWHAECARGTPKQWSSRWKAATPGRDVGEGYGAASYGPWTPAVHALLGHLEQRGFDGAPHMLGLDDQGRELLTFYSRLDRGLSAAVAILGALGCRPRRQPAV